MKSLLLRSAVLLVMFTLSFTVGRISARVVRKAPIVKPAVFYTLADGTAAAA
jgi:hypothetical protein